MAFAAAEALGGALPFGLGTGFDDITEPRKRAAAMTHAILDPIAQAGGSIDGSFLQRLFDLNLGRAQRSRSLHKRTQVMAASSGAMNPLEEVYKQVHRVNETLDAIEDVPFIGGFLAIPHRAGRGAALVDDAPGFEWLKWIRKKIF